MTPPTLAWLDGAFVPFSEAKIHVRSDAVMRGGSVFEGIPVYWSEEAKELWIFRFDEHLARLGRSMKVLRLHYPLEELRVACIELVRRCGFREDVHLRPTVAFGQGAPFAFRPEDVGVTAFITAVPFPRVAEFAVRGLQLTISSWQRISDLDQPPRVKSAANYLNGRLAQTQATHDGYDGAILLNRHGYVAEGPAACIALVRDGVLITPRLTDGVLESLTRATVLKLAEERGLRTEERAVDRTELYVANEVFECGSAHEITPVVGVDGYPIGDGTPGPVTCSLVAAYRDAVHGMDSRHRSWVTPVYRESVETPLDVTPEIVE